jgi:hypothetical protein
MHKIYTHTYIYMNDIYEMEERMLRLIERWMHGRGWW